jgi:hypothetical protein
VNWFYGFKLHLVINDQVELLVVKTEGNVDGRGPVPELARSLFRNFLVIRVASR